MSNPGHGFIPFIFAVTCISGSGVDTAAQVEPKAATEAAKKANAAVLNQLPFADKQDFEDANRGLIGTVPAAVVVRRG